MPKNKELFERNNIDVDFSNLGIVTDEEYELLVRDYYGKGERVPKERHTVIQKVLLPFKDKNMFFEICRNLLKKYNFKIKLRIPFLPI